MKTLKFGSLRCNLQPEVLIKIGACKMWNKSPTAVVAPKTQLDDDGLCNTCNSKLEASDLFLQPVMEAMQAAKELGGPEGQDYIDLMERSSQKLKSGSEHV